MVLILLEPLLETPKLEGKVYKKMLEVFELLSSETQAQAQDRACSCYTLPSLIFIPGSKPKQCAKTCLETILLSPLFLFTCSPQPSHSCFHFQCFDVLLKKQAR